MKVLYVGDGRCRTNWGARATSTALHDLLAKSNVISGIIESTAKDPNHPRMLAFPLMPGSLLRAIDKANPALFNQMTRVTRKLGLGIGVVDYISDDVDVSLKNFYKKKDQYPELARIYKLVSECDAVALNGEGSFIFKTPARRDASFFLFILKLAIDMGKKAYYLNAIISDCPVTGRNMNIVTPMMKIFQNCELVTLRDPLSYRELMSLGTVPDARYIPDALFTWYPRFENRNNLPRSANDIILNKQKFAQQKLDFSKPYICVSGSSLAAWKKQDAMAAYTNLVEQLKKLDVQTYIVPTCPGDSFLNKVGEITNTPVIPLEIDVVTGGAILANAAVFVSGRYHPSILASLGGTPCVFMGSNSHKTVSLQEMLGYEDVIEYNAIPSQTDIEQILVKVSGIISQGDVLRNKIFNNVKSLSDAASQISVLVRDKQ